MAISTNLHEPNLRPGPFGTVEIPFSMFVILLEAVGGAFSMDAADLARPFNDRYVEALIVGDDPLRLLIRIKESG